MSIIKWEPLTDMNKLFEDFPILPFRNYGRDLAVDLYEDKGDIIAKVNLPGIAPERINVSVEDNYLRISGTLEEENESSEKHHYYSKEIKKGFFERLIYLPQHVEKEKVTAEYDKGVLKVSLPKAKDAESPHKVEIKIKT